MFKLQFDKSQIKHWASRYKIDEREKRIENEIAPVAKSGRFLTKEYFLIFGEWKSPRVRKWREQNTENSVMEITFEALSSSNEGQRIQLLTRLRGVGWPTASVILHFAHCGPYPILDFRALWSLSTDVPKSYCFDFWWAYTLYCRQLARSCGVSMRTLDRALWQYSKENQPKKWRSKSC